MSYRFVPDVIKSVIETKSKKDCILDAPKFYMNPTFIPASLTTALKDYNKAVNKNLQNAKEYHTIICGLKHFKNWTPEIYWYLCKLLLYLEYFQSVEDMKQYSLKNQQIFHSIYQAESFVIPVPNLSEHQSVKENDLVDILQVKGTNHCVGSVNWVGKDYVTVKVEVTFMSKFKENQRFNIEFRYDPRSIICQNHALNRVYQNNMTPMFFPHKNIDAVASPDIHIEWINANIKTNPEQMQAVENILKKTSHQAPYIVFGPPGTGKTSTLVEAICQIMVRNPSSRILICTPSNSAADEIVERIIKNSQCCLVENSIFRMYGSSRKSKDIKPSLNKVSNFADTKIISVAKEVFLTKKIVITTLITSARLHCYNLRPDHFSYVFIDEAGQATELETLIPFILTSGVNLNDECQLCGQVVIAGDPKQLGPFCKSKLAEPLLSKSMLERLMEHGPYLKHENQKYDPMYVTKLVQNFRCHESILHVPNILFYDGELIAKGGEDTTRALKWSKLPKKGFPVIFHAVRGKESRIDDSPSVCNHAEVSIVMEYIKKLRNSKCDEISINLDDVGIITPYRLQKKMINDALQKQNLEKISVGTVEAFQGREKDVIIISTVRTCVYKTDKELFVGFLSNPKRFNVALTRAKSLLIIIGHPDVLQQDKSWGTFIEYCVKNGACKGEKFSSDPSIHNLDIRSCSTTPNTHTKWHKNNTNPLPVIEDENSCPNGRDEFNKNRRRRLPIGPLPEEVIDSENAIKTFLKYQRHDEPYQEDLNWRENDLRRDEFEEDYSTDENENHDDDNDSWKSELSFEVNEFCNDYVEKLFIEEEEFKSKLDIRMAELRLG